MLKKKVTLQWMEEPARHLDGQVLGIPFEQGEMQELPSATWKERPVQTWPMAYWPDGSMKWMGTALSGVKATGDSAYEPKVELILRGFEEGIDHQKMVQESLQDVTIDTGKLRIVMNKSGKYCIESMILGEGTQLAKRGRLVGIAEFHEESSTCRRISQYPFSSVVHQVTVEQEGPLRAVVKIEGCHQMEGYEEGCDKPLFPFCLRVIAYKDSDQIELKHSFIYDRKGEDVFIKGIGISFDVPMVGAVYNRQIKFAGDSGMFTENCRFMSTRIKDYMNLYRRQVEGEHFPADKELDYVQDMAIWNDYKLKQTTSESYRIMKRTGEGCSYINCDFGRRSNGSVYVGDEEKGILVGVKDSWQKGPMMFEAKNLASEVGTINLWFWSPDEEAMDMRHYDKVTHVISSYEGAHELDATPYGIGNTHELRIIGFEHRVDDRTLFDIAKEIQRPPRLRCELSRYHQSRALGIYSMKKPKDQCGPKRNTVEDQLDRILDFYKAEVDQRKWYGCWNYGDFMHTYDQVRHKWRYDMGGYAWQNTELAPNFWLWFAYLRSGDVEIFRMAEAMTRHTSEVDLYHIGPYKGLGSRHNVSHWGCGAKEPRIGMAGLHRFYYYLTCDERIGDIMDEVVHADFSTLNKDPMREYYGDDSYETHARSGPDWVAYMSNWYTAYERTRSESILEKLMQGIDSLYKMPHRLLSGSCFGYTPEDGRLHYMGEDTYGYHLAICMGGPQVWMEVADLLPDERMKAMIIEFGEFYFLSHDEKKAKTSAEISAHWDWPMFATGISAYAAKQTNNQALAMKTREVLLGEKDRCIDLPVEVKRVHTPHMVDSRQEIEGITTNTMSQWSLNAIVCMELIELDECNDTQEH